MTILSRHSTRFVLIALLTILGLLVTTSPASATAKPPKFSGALPGIVTCNVSAKLKFSPPLTPAGGGTNASKIKGTLSGCAPSNSVIDIKSAKIKGSFASSPISCTTLSDTGSAPTFTVTWKGTVNGTLDGATYGGNGHFSKSSASGGAVSGSFAGSLDLNIGVPSNLATLCDASGGLKTLTATGSFIVGADSGGPGGAGGGVPLNGVPAQISSSFGSGYCTVLTSGSVECWGDNSSGELGNGTGTSSSCAQNGCYSTTPVTVTGVTNAVNVQGDFENGYCAVLSSGGVKCWGDNSTGELGSGDNDTGPQTCYLGACSTTALTVTGISNAKSLTPDFGGFCAVLKSGGVDCWGDNSADDLGDGSDTAPDCSGSCSDVPVAVTGMTDAASLASAGDGYCAVLTSGGVDCWGDNSEGELGTGSDTGPNCSGYCSNVPVAATGITDAASLASDEDGYCAVLTSGGVDCWGDNSEGELGAGIDNTGPDTCGDFGCSTTPVAATGITDAASIDSATNGYCAVLTSGGIDCWGINNLGQLGDGSDTGLNCSGGCSDAPVAVSGITDAVSVTNDGYAYCSSQTGGHVDCWGDNEDGSLGVGAGQAPDSCIDTHDCSTVPLITAFNDVASFSNNEWDSICGVLASGHLDCWGDDASGQLGNWPKTLTVFTGMLNVTPNSGLTNEESVSITGEFLEKSSPGIVLECNETPDEPSVALGGLVNTSVAVGCTAPSAADIVTTTSTGTLSTSYTVTTGTIGPPCGGSSLASCPSLDSAGNTPAADAADYPCPPTPAQQAAGVTCSLEFGDSAGDLVDGPILYSGETAP